MLSGDDDGTSDTSAQGGARVKVAFLVLNHRPPAQAERLLATLRRSLPDAALVVHHDRFATPLTPGAFAQVGGVIVRESPEPIAWGGFGIVDAYWTTLRWMAGAVDFDWVVLLSGQDYPIKPLKHFERYLQRVDVDAFVEAVPLAAVTDPIRHQDLVRRYYYRYRPGPPRRILPATGRMGRILHGASGRAINVLNDHQRLVQVYFMPDGRHIGFRARRTPFARTPAYYGEMWTTLSRTAVDTLLTHLDRHPDYREYYRHTMVPDESATASIIANAAHLRRSDHCLQYIRWRDGSSHPDVFDEHDFDELRGAPNFFARKFDLERSGRLLDRLDAWLEEGAA
jgi:hypothetical protein